MGDVSDRIGRPTDNGQVLSCILGKIMLCSWSLIVVSP